MDISIFSIYLRSYLSIMQHILQLNIHLILKDVRAICACMRGQQQCEYPITQPTRRLFTICIHDMLPGGIGARAVKFTQRMESGASYSASFSLRRSSSPRTPIVTPEVGGTGLTHSACWRAKTAVWLMPWGAAEDFASGPRPVF